MKFPEIKFILLTFLSITLFSKIENLALNNGTSWTFAKLLPYGFTILCGILLFFQVKKISFKKPILKYASLLLVLILPFSIGFSFHPIYEGDFNLSSEKVITNFSPIEFVNDGITVATIPNCPFCFESIKTLKKIKKRNPDLKIDFIVCAKNSKYLKKYLTEIDGDFEIRLAKNPDSLAFTSGLRFPTFYLVKDKKPVFKWSNDQFSVRSIDVLESKL